MALLEVGAAAGLTLLPDRYSYNYAGHRVGGADPLAPTLYCEPRGPVPLPARGLSVAWRAGIDVNPLDVANDDDVRWLECMLWPGEAGREERLHKAVAAARRHRPRVFRGDLVDDLARVAADAPRQATLVVFHSAVLAYVDADKRRAFADAVRSLDAVWLSNEAPGVAAPPTSVESKYGRECFALLRGGRELLALADGHGAWVDWVTDQPLGDDR